MDLLYFARSRLRFIRSFYGDAASPFVERKRKIEASESPFEPPYSEDGDLPFEIEWLDADEAIDLLGQACISLLASTLKLYLTEWVDDVHRRLTRESLAQVGIGRPEDDRAAFKKGWINGYRTYFRETLEVDWSEAPANVDLLEEIVLARNRAQHPETLMSFHIRQSTQDAAKFPRSFFADDFELRMYAHGDVTIDESVRPWRLNVTGPKLFAAIDEVEEFCSWLEQQRLAWRRRAGES